MFWRLSCEVRLSIDKRHLYEQLYGWLRSLKTEDELRHVVRDLSARYQVDIDVKKVVDEAELVDVERKVEVKKNLKKLFLDRYLNQKEVTSEKKAQGSSYFFSKLSF